MDLRVFTEPQQGATYDDLLAVAQRAEQLGFDAFFRSDHFLSMGGDGLPGSTDAWLTLAAMARETSTIRLGTLMTSATFRLPGPLAIAVAQVDQMSGGRVELGIGAGWFEAEHAAYGIPFPSTGERFDRFEEQLAVVTGLWGTPVGERFDFAGEPLPGRRLPRPAQARPAPRPPIIIGGKGKKRTPALAARYADEFNVPFDSVEATRTLVGRVRTACEDAGRDPDELVYSNALVLCVGSRRGRARPPRGRHRPRGRTSSARTAWPAPRRRWSTGSASTPPPGRRGSTCRSWTWHDLDHLDLVAAEVMPHV